MFVIRELGHGIATNSGLYISEQILDWSLELVQLRAYVD